MRFIAIASLSLMIGCPKPITPPVQDPTTQEGYPLCKSTVQVLTSDICMGNQFTIEGYVCAACRGGADAKGCINEEAGVYCVESDCLRDLTCKLVDTTDANWMMNRMSHVHKAKPVKK